MSCVRDGGHSLANNKRRFAPAVLALLLLCACGPDHIATVNGRKLPIEEFRKLKEGRIKELKVANRPYDPLETGRAVLEEMISSALIAEGARKRGIEIPDHLIRNRFDALRGDATEKEFIGRLREKGVRFEDFLEEIKKEMLKEEFIKTFSGIQDVPLSEVKRQYDLGRRPVMKPARLKIRIILASNAMDAESIYRELESKTFDSVVEGLISEKAAKVSEPDWVELDSLPGAMAEALRDAREGAHSHPVLVEDGWYMIVKIYEKTPAEFFPFEDAKELVMFKLIDEKRQEAFKGWISEERRKADVKIKEKYL